MISTTENTAANPEGKTTVSLATIEALTRKFADARESLQRLVKDLNDQIDKATRAAMPDIKKTVQRAAEWKAELSTAIESAPDLFVKPRTVLFHGIKVGFEKGKGEIEIMDEDRTMKLIHKHLPDQEDVLIKTDQWVAKAALKSLTVEQLEKIGCTVESTGDQIVIRPTDKEVEKTVKALLKAAAKETEET